MKTTDVLGCVGGAAFFLLISTIVPFFGPFFCPLTSLPFLYYSTKLGIHDGVKLTGLTLLFIFLVAELTGYPQLIHICIELSVLGLALSVLFRKKLGIGQTILLATGLMVLLNLGYLFFISLSREFGPFEMITQYLYEHLKVTIQAYEEMGISKENLHEIETYGKAIIETVSLSLVTVGIGLCVWLNVVIAKPVFRWVKLEYPGFVPMDRWQAPESMIWGVIGSGFALFLFSGAIKLIAANVLIVLIFIYFFQGVSIILFFLNKYHLPPWIRLGVYFLIIIQQLFLVLLAIAGLFDQWIDFRKLKTESETS